MEMGNVSKRQQLDHRADNSRRPPMGLQCSEKLPHQEASFSWPLNKYVYYVSDNGRHTKLRIIHIIKHFLFVYFFIPSQGYFCFIVYLLIFYSIHDIKKKFKTKIAGTLIASLLYKTTAIFHYNMNKNTQFRIAEGRHCV